MTKEMKKLVEEKAYETACKVCSPNCIASYDCPKKATAGLLPPAGTETVCPLAKYDAPAEVKDPFKDHISLEDLFYACRNCEHVNNLDEEKNWERDREKVFETVCIDCPIQMCRENILEARAEAAMS